MSRRTVVPRPIRFSLIFWPGFDYFADSASSEGATLSREQKATIGKGL